METTPSGWPVEIPGLGPGTYFKGHPGFCGTCPPGSSQRAWTCVQYGGRYRCKPCAIAEARTAAALQEVQA